MEPRGHRSLGLIVQEAEEHSHDPLLLLERWFVASSVEGRHSKLRETTAEGHQPMPTPRKDRLTSCSFVCCSPCSFFHLTSASRSHNRNLDDVAGALGREVGERIRLRSYAAL